MSQALGQEHADLLAQVEIFRELDRVTLAKLAAHLEPVRVPPGAVVFHVGDPGDAFYLVVRGTFGRHVLGPDGAQTVRLDTLGPGTPFGEMALLTNSPRSATIRADTDGQVLRLPRSRFLELVRREPAVAMAVASGLSRSLATARQLAREPRGGGAPVVREREAAERASASGPPPATAAPTPAATGRAGRRTLAWLAALAVMLAVWLLPPPEGLGVAGWRALGTVLALVPLLAFDVLPEGILALLLPTAWVLCGVAPTRVALAGFASPSFVLVVAILALGAGVASSGLLYRLALGVVERAPGGFAGRVAALGIAGVLISPAMPNATGRVALLAPALTEVVEALGYAPRSRPAAGLAMAALAGFGQMTAAFLTSSTTALLVFAVLPAATRAELDWTRWAVRAAPVTVVVLATLLTAIAVLYRPRTPAERGTEERSGALALQQALLGPLAREERAALAVAAALVVGFVTQPLHRTDPAWVAVLALAALAITGAVGAETLRAVNWSFALLFGMLASLSEVLAATGADRWLAGLVAGAAGPLAGGPAAFVAGLAVLAGAVSFILRWQASAPLLAITLAPAASAAGIDPFVVGLVVVMAGNGFFLPYQSTIYLALYHGTEGRLFSHVQARPAALAYGLAVLVACLLAIPVWRALGLV